MDDIVRDYHPTLREKSEEIVFPLNENLKKLATEMIDFLKNSQDPKTAEKYDLRPGVGIAAPQLDIPKQMLAVH
ncbi:peptide deformylase, partial [Salmonella enterica]|uniref:peptide deformylase n=1 Tax=Salmonella enterica TaxID=28901 RepID=UPI001BAE6905